MQTEQLRRLRDISVAIGENALNVLPFHARETGYRMRDRIVEVFTDLPVCIEDLIGVRRFAEIMTERRMS